MPNFVISRNAKSGSCSSTYNITTSHDNHTTVNTTTQVTQKLKIIWYYRLFTKNQILSDSKR